MKTSPGQRPLPRPGGAFFVPMGATLGATRRSPNDYAAITVPYRRLYASVLPTHLRPPVVEHARLGAHLLGETDGVSHTIVATALAEALLLAGASILRPAPSRRRRRHLRPGPASGRSRFAPGVRPCRADSARRAGQPWTCSPPTGRRCFSLLQARCQPPPATRRPCSLPVPAAQRDAVSWISGAPTSQRSPSKEPGQSTPDRPGEHHGARPFTGGWGCLV